METSVFRCLNMTDLPSHDTLFSLCDAASSMLEAEICDYRLADQSDNPGGLVELKEKLPVVIVPDIHARPDFIKNILEYELGKDFGFEKSITIEEALKQKKIYVVCVGDAIHTEKTMYRWQLIQEAFDCGQWDSDEMKTEMLLCISALSSLMALKLTYKKYFHFLKGNHENITNQTADGDFAFKKYADEGFMTREFIRNYYGDDILYLISCYEKALPLVACSKEAKCVISHAEPAGHYSKEDIINARDYSETVRGLTWTANGQVLENTCWSILKQLLETEDLTNAFCFGGHRPVSKNYALRQNGIYVQIHNPEKQNIAIVVPGKGFNPDCDIVSVN